MIKMSGSELSAIAEMTEQGSRGSSPATAVPHRPSRMRTKDL